MFAFVKYITAYLVLEGNHSWWRDNTSIRLLCVCICYDLVFLNSWGNTDWSKECSERQMVCRSLAGAVSVWEIDWLWEYRRAWLAVRRQLRTDLPECWCVRVCVSVGPPFAGERELRRYALQQQAGGEKAPGLKQALINAAAPNCL